MLSNLPPDVLIMLSLFHRFKPFICLEIFIIIHLKVADHCPHHLLFLPSRELVCCPRQWPISAPGVLGCPHLGGNFAGGQHELGLPPRSMRCSAPVVRRHERIFRVAQGSCSGQVNKVPCGSLMHGGETQTGPRSMQGGAPCDIRPGRSTKMTPPGPPSAGEGQAEWGCRLCGLLTFIGGCVRFTQHLTLRIIHL